MLEIFSLLSGCPNCYVLKRRNLFAKLLLIITCKPYSANNDLRKTSLLYAFLSLSFTLLFCYLPINYLSSQLTSIFTSRCFASSPALLVVTRAACPLTALPLLKNRCSLPSASPSPLVYTSASSQSSSLRDHGLQLHVKQPLLFLDPGAAGSKRLVGWCHGRKWTDCGL